MERERKLASVQHIVALDPIEGADKIEVATILGWHVVVEKGKYKVGDLIVYCEVDSLIPLRTEFIHLQDYCAVKNVYVDGKSRWGYRIKTAKLRGQISQGIVFALDVLVANVMVDGKPQRDIIDWANPMYRGEPLQAGLDVTEHLDICKYEMPLPSDLAGKARGGWPGFMPKTDEPRLQGMPGLLDKYKDLTFYATEKIDGSSVTLFIKNDEMHCAGRTIDWLDDGKNVIWRVAKELNIEAKLRELGYADRIALQGEIFGPGIQGNPLRQSRATIRFYNAYDWVRGSYLPYAEFTKLIADMGLELVPVITDNFKLLPTVDDMVAYANRDSVLNPDVKLEGVVFRPLDEYKDPDIGRLSFKVISPEYLLKHES